MKFEVGKRTKPKVNIPLGALMDIPTASFITGSKGETIINGGLSPITAITGAGNNYKTTILHYMTLAAANVTAMYKDPFIHTYDTEVNIQLDRPNNLSKNFTHLTKNGARSIIFDEEPLWSITDKSQYNADDWVNIFKENLDSKIKDKDSQITYTAINDPYTQKPLKSLLPSFIQIDSVTDFEPGNTVKMFKDNEKNDSSTNMMYMQQGMYKAKFLGMLPSITSESNTNLLLTAQLGDDYDMSGNKYQKPTRKLQYLKIGDKLKGVSPKFTFLTTTFWYAHTASVLKNQTTRLPEYPLGGNDKVEQELQTVSLTLLRCKNGNSGITIELVVSQNEGLLPTLTEFHYIKNNGRFGLSGNNTNYHLDLYPSVNLKRTTVRNKINNDEKLRNAVKYTSELLQLDTFFPVYRADDLMCTPKELKEDLEAMGYDWDLLLTARSFQTIDNYAKHLPPFLSIVDLLKMRKKLYVPYWYDKSKLKDITNG